ncbi:hypothetical protein [Aureimonas glaciei]|uniref:Uncharacterized protein n=1 Tax=Aureimonas glaciei TaxID=1776957 RepID=A0A916YGP2_9HYPH|nr:hypothetical protein [Aureimonas glaciei]GGD43898.1 hypothetical protein GCM10011335_53160 [Aureimonas glaciei]
MNAALRSLRAAVADIASIGDPRSTAAAEAATSALDRLEASFQHQRRDHSMRLLAGVDLDCVTKCDLVGGGGVEVRARHTDDRYGTVEVEIIYVGDESRRSDSNLIADAGKAGLDSLVVEIVRRNVAMATDGDLLSALDAAERGEDPEIGEILAAAHDRNLRLLS